MLPNWMLKAAAVMVIGAFCRKFAAPLFIGSASLNTVYDLPLVIV